MSSVASDSFSIIFLDFEPNVKSVIVPCCLLVGFPQEKQRKLRASYIPDHQSALSSLALGRALTKFIFKNLFVYSFSYYQSIIGST